MNRPELFFSGNLTFTDVLAQIADNTKEISETLKKRPREEPERVVVCVREDDGDFLYVYWKPFDAETVVLLEASKKADLHGRVIGANNEGAGEWTMAMFDLMSEMTSNHHCVVFHFL